MSDETKRAPDGQKAYYYVVRETGGDVVQLRPMDPFAAARYEELRLLCVQEWMELTDAGLTSDEAWEVANQRFSMRWFGEEVQQ